jgi:hypothetical protein
VQPNSNAKCWVGIDVCQEWVDVVVLVEEHKAEQLRCERSAEGVGRLAQQLLPYGPQAGLRPAAAFQRAAWSGFETASTGASLSRRRFKGPAPHFRLTHQLPVPPADLVPAHDR